MKAIVLASLLGGAAGAVVVNGTINYSSPFKLTVPIDSAFHVVPSVANIWQAQVDGIAGSATENILVDIDGDGVMDTSDPKVKVVITDFWASGGGAFLEHSGGMSVDCSSSQPRHLTTPIVLPVGSDLWLRNGSGVATTATFHLIGRVQNL